MSDLSTESLQQLLDRAGAGPWDYVPGEAIDERCIVNLDTTTPCIAIVENDAGSDCSDDDLKLAALAPELAREVLRLRSTIQSIVDNKASSDSTHNNPQLAVTAPELENDIIRLRTEVEQILDMCLLKRDAALNDTPMRAGEVVAFRAGEVVAFNLCAEHLDNLLKNHDLEHYNG